MSAGRPLARFPVASTTNRSEAVAAYERIYARPKLEFADREPEFRLIVNYCQLQQIGLIYASCNAGSRIRYPETDCALQVFTMKGGSTYQTAGTSAVADPDYGAVTSPHEVIHSTSGPEYERLVLKINSALLSRKLSTIVGAPCDGALKFNLAQNYELAAARVLRDHFFFLVSALSRASATPPKLVLDEFEQTLMVMFLCANRHNFSYLLDRTPPDVALEQIRRAEEYIEASSHQPITLEDLSDVTGLSAFSLFRAFKKCRGYSPMEFASRVRLRRARELLMQPSAAITIADVGHTCGFFDLGRFTNDYVRAFGEHPLMTLKRSRGDDSPARP